jgi:hypothetical protein
MARLAGLCALAVCVLAASAGATIFPGKSQALMPTLKEIGFTHVLAFKPAKKPPATLAQGYKNGVSALVQKGTTASPTEAVVTAYVYSSTAAATLAWKHACAKCKTVSAPQGLRLKAEAGTSNNLPTLHEVSACGNVYLDVIEQGPESASKLDSDVAKITSAVYARAIHGGLSSCTAK